MLFAEDLFAAPQATYDQITDFLGLARAPLTDPRAFKANVYEPIPPEMERRLADYYAAPNEDLFQLLNRRAPWTC